MPFIIGTPIPEDKILVQSVSQIYGIGLSQSKILCRKADSVRIVEVKTPVFLKVRS